MSYINRIRIAGDSEFGIEYYDNDYRRHEEVVLATTKEVAVQRFVDSKKIPFEVVREVPWTVDDESVKEVESIVHKGWEYFPRTVLSRVTPKDVEAEIKCLANGFSLDSEKLKAVTKVVFIPFND